MHGTHCKGVQMQPFTVNAPTRTGLSISWSIKCSRYLPSQQFGSSLACWELHCTARVCWYVGIEEDGSPTLPALMRYIKYTANSGLVWYEVIRTVLYEPLIVHGFHNFNGRPVNFQNCSWLAGFPNAIAPLLASSDSRSSTPIAIARS